MKSKQKSEEGRRKEKTLEGIKVAEGNMKPDRDTAEEFFEYDAEEFLIFLTLLITEGRTPECSVKGRTEGLHCPPAQSAMPVLTKHECSDKLPQCRQARRTRSEVMLLWRNNIPIMIEVMLLPDCCYSDEGLTTDGTDINDPAIKQDALLLERWTLQQVPRQSGDRFIEEKTLLLAVRSYVFFSQLSAWLSASHGIVPRNILYRISAADEELVWNFSQTPSEHAFPVPNVSHSVALKVSVQSLPRQPNYPVLKCSIHSGLSFLGKRSLEPGEGPLRAGELGESHGGFRLQGSPLLSRPLRSPLPQSPLNARKYQPPEALPPGKAAKWFYSKLNSGPDIPPAEVRGSYANGAESLKAPGTESPIHIFKSLSLTDPPATPSPSPRPLSGETNPLIGSLLQERQEVIARIAQRLNFCDPTAPHIPDALFPSPRGTGETQAPKTLWGSHQDEGPFKKTKEPSFPTPPAFAHDRGFPERAGPERSRPSLFDTPLSAQSKARLDNEPRLSPRPAICRKLLLGDSTENSLISEAMQDISRLIQDRLQNSQSLLNCTYKLCKEGSLLKPPPDRPDCSQGNQCDSRPPSHRTSADSPNIGNIAKPHICTDLSGTRLKDANSIQQDCSHRPQNVACLKLEDARVKPELKTFTERLQNAKNDSSWNSVVKNKESGRSPENSPRENGPSRRERLPAGEAVRARGFEQATTVQSGPKRDENRDPSAPTTSLTHSPPSPESSPRPETPCNNWKKQNRHSIDGTATKAFHPCTGLPLLSSPVPQRKSQTGYFDLDASLIGCKGLPWASSKRVCLKREADRDEPQQQLLSASAPPASLSLLGNFEECVLNYRLEPLGNVEGFTAEVGASGTFCPSHMTLPVDVSFYSVSDDNAPSPYMGVINLESLGKRGYRVPPSGTIQVTLFNPNKTVVKMFVVMYDLREMPANHQTFLRQRTFSVPVKRESNGHVNKKSPPLGQGRTLRYLVHLRFQSSKSGKIYLHRDIRLLFSRKSMEVDSGAAYELKSFTESPADPPFSPRC
ncbi:atos homolog protein A isoform X2 [Chanos chanos]|uniref:Atos homolog protein A n=1 Tax=Chanos chanos TaxID=29144 RepID=A0A6J2ULC4_CHACN|nr:protein FAM214A isoform X2 [Chanos chanos]